MTRRRVLLLSLLLPAGLLLGLRLVPATPLLSGTSFSRAVADRHGRLLRLTLSQDEKFRVFTRLADVAPVAIEATLLHEDRHFYVHPGVDPLRLVKAAAATWLRRGRRQGGSTITMQVARMLLHLDTRTVHGKLVQIGAALWMELCHSKQEILEAYLNLAPYGGNVEGIGAASELLFDVAPDRLGLNQALTLALLPQSPSARVVPGHGPRFAPGLAIARSRLLARFRAAHPDAPGDQELAALDTPAAGKPLPFLAPHFVDELLSRASGASGLRTTIDLDLQRVVERTVRRYVDARPGLDLDGVAVLLVDSRDMSVEAAVGSPDYFDSEHAGQVNALAAKRSPGSTLKPFIYALALDQGLIHPESLLKDSPVDFAGFDPENFDQTFVGPISAREALIRSRNVPALRLAAQLRRPGLYGFLREAQVRLPRDESYYGLGLVLGSAEVSPEELAQLYAMLASGGRIRPLRRLVDDPRPRGEELLSPEACWMTLDMLAGNPPPGQGFRAEWTLADRAIPWKTGTSNGFRDAWAAGVLGDQVLVVWVGHPDGHGDPALVGREIAGPLFFALADALKGEGLGFGQGLARPRSLVKVPVCALSGGLPTAACPLRRYAWFWPGVSPVRPCEVHRKVRVDALTGRRVCGAHRGETRVEVDEFWPSDLLRIFALAGLPRRLPPPPEPGCSLDALAATGDPPEIVSPVRGVTYAARLTGDEAIVPLTATADADVQRISWFLGGRLLGESDPREPFLWPAAAGDYVVRAVDDHGRSASRSLTVGLE